MAKQHEFVDEVPIDDSDKIIVRGDTGIIAPAEGAHEVGWDDYRAWPLPSQSSLKMGLQSPAHMKSALDGERLEIETDAMRLGTALHCALLEPRDYKRRIAVWEGAARRGNKWDDFAAMNASRVILTEDQAARVFGMVAALHKHPAVIGLMPQFSRRELSVIGTVYGVRCKARIDLVGDAILADIKTCRSAGVDAMQRACLNYGYHIQAAMYTQLVPGAEFHIIAVESTPPYDVLVFHFDRAFMRRGEDDLTVCCQLYQEGMRTNRWPGRSLHEVSMRLPEWMTVAEKITIDGESIDGEDEGDA